jgi:hypothetical protein
MEFNCTHMDECGFCRKYSNLDADYKCPEDGDCECWECEEDGQL